VLSRYWEEAELPVAPDSYSQPQVIKALQNAYQELENYKKCHKELRASFLEDLALARVLHSSPHLSHDALHHIKEDRSLRELKQLFSRENIRRSHRKIGRTLHMPTNSGLSRIDVPNSSAANTQTGDPNQPKTWTGHGKQSRNHNKLHRDSENGKSGTISSSSPDTIWSGPLASAMGRTGDTLMAKALLQGTLPSVANPLLSETTNILKN
jgi:hypothetical protein